MNCVHEMDLFLMIVFSVLVAELVASSLNLLGSAVRLQHKARKLSRSINRLL